MFKALIAVMTFSSLLWADTNTCANFYINFENIRSQYKMLSCSDNVVILADELVRRGVDAKNIKILIIAPKNPNNYIKLQDDRFPPDDGYPFHVVVQLGKNIYDMDHLGFEGSPIPVGTYFKKMLGTDNLSFTDIDTIQYSFPEYKERQKTFGRMAHLFNLDLSPHPRKALSDYVAEFGLNYKDLQSRIATDMTVPGFNQIAFLIESHHDRLKTIPIGSGVHFVHEVPPTGHHGSFSGQLLEVHPRHIKVQNDQGTKLDILLQSINFDSIYGHTLQK